MPSLIGNKPNQVPTNGDLGKMAFRDTVVRVVQSNVATAGQTTFTITRGYTPGLIDIYLNGIKLFNTDYTATNGTTVVLAVGATLNDELEFIVWG